ncbi:MAG: hypothetical protein ACRDRS_26230 [Pseudonocardiaceae bacterium]
MTGALITAAGAVVAAVITHEPTTPAATPPAATAPASQPSTLPTPGDSGNTPIPRQLAQVEFVSSPVGDEINPGEDVPLAGSVTGLGGNTLWIRAGLRRAGPGLAPARRDPVQLTKLASLTMVTGDPLQAAALGHAALDIAGTIRSRRAAEELRELAHYAERVVG